MSIWMPRADFRENLNTKQNCCMMIYQTIKPPACKKNPTLQTVDLNPGTFRQACQLCRKKNSGSMMHDDGAIRSLMAFWVQEFFPSASKMQWADGAALPLLQLIGCTNTEPGILGFAFLGPFTVGIVGSTLSRTPHLKLEVLWYKLFVVFVMCVAQADGIRRTVVPACHIVLLLVFCSPAESEALCPDYPELRRNRTCNFEPPSKTQCGNGSNHLIQTFAGICKR